jgi:protein involved in ribonucleotide reduction
MAGYLDAQKRSFINNHSGNQFVGTNIYGGNVNFGGEL